MKPIAKVERVVMKVAAFSYMASCTEEVSSATLLLSEFGLTRSNQPTSYFNIA